MAEEEERPILQDFENDGEGEEEGEGIIKSVVDGYIDNEYSINTKDDEDIESAGDLKAVIGKIEPYYDVFQKSMESCGFSTFLCIFEVLFIVLCFVLIRNGEDYFLDKHPNESDPDFQIYHHVYMEIAGFGLLMSFLRLHGLYAMGMAFLISCFCMQLTIFCVGYTEKIADLINGEDDITYFVVLDLPMFIKSLFSAAAVLISMGVVIGKFTPFQLIIMVLIEVPFYALNVMLVEDILEVSDAGGSMLIHAFGAYYGLTLSWFGGPCTVSCGKNNKKISLAKETTDRISDLVSIVGTISLWIFWPSFCGALSVGYQHRVDINTILSLMSCCITAFVVSRVFRCGKFGMEDLQNATIAGGVAIGSLSDMKINPGFSCVMGTLAGIISCFGYRVLSPILRLIGLHDTCGVHNLHGMPGLLGGIGSIFGVLAMHDSVKYGYAQPAIQFAGLVVTLIMAILGGIFASLVTRLGLLCCYPRKRTDYFEDDAYFILESEEEEEENDEEDEEKKKTTEVDVDYDELGKDKDE